MHKNAETAEKIQRKIVQAENERKELSGIRKWHGKEQKKASLHNKKLRDRRLQKSGRYEKRKAH